MHCCVRPWVAPLLCALALTGGGCRTPLRTNLWSLLESGPVTADEVWQEARIAHTGGRRLLSVGFAIEERFQPGVSEAFYPDLAGGWTAYQRFELDSGRAFMVAQNRDSRVQWAWNGQDLTATREGKPYTPKAGLNRAVHLQAMRTLLVPWEPVPHHKARAVWMESHNRNWRIQVTGVEDPTDVYVMEVDPESSRVVALESTMHRFGLPGTLRHEFDDFREVAGGVVSAHHVVELWVTAVGNLRYHEMNLWNLDWATAPLLPPSQPAFP